MCVYVYLSIADVHICISLGIDVSLLMNLSIDTLRVPHVSKPLIPVAPPPTPPPPPIDKKYDF